MLPIELPNLDTIGPPHMMPVEGGNLAYLSFGQQGGAPLIFLHGGPGSRLEGVIFDRAARALGVHLVAFDRPGLGASTYRAPVTLKSVASDVVALADHLEFERPAVMGWSGGGVLALACAGFYPERFSQVITLASYTRLDRQEMRDLVPEPDRTASKLMVTQEWLFRSFFHLGRVFIKIAPGLFMKSLIDDACASDREIYLDPAMSRLLLEDQREALRTGIDGIVADAKLSYVSDWGYDPSQMTTPVHIFQGTADTRVPRAFGEDLARLIPDSTAHFLEGMGHLFPVTHAHDILGLVVARTPTPATT